MNFAKSEKVRGRPIKNHGKFTGFHGRFTGFRRGILKNH